MSKTHAEAKDLASQGQEESTGKLSASAVKSMTQAGAVMQDGKVDFDAIQGEAFLGLNLLSLNIDEADGPFLIESIDPTEFKQGKKVTVIDVYVTKKGTTEVRMPISASFMTKAKEANLKIGDVFYVKRGRDFRSKEFGTENCKSYMIKVSARA